jgi:tRNA 2-thiocytidine biosynthesis protein TtcA
MYLAEADIGAFAKAQGFPILPCNLCGSKTDGSPGQRAQMKMLLATLDSLGDGAARQNMLHALSDVRPTHLLGARPSSALLLFAPCLLSFLPA